VEKNAADLKGITSSPVMKVVAGTTQFDRLQILSVGGVVPKRISTASPITPANDAAIPVTIGLGVSEMAALFTRYAMLDDCGNPAEK
jgi:hypothetical protein